MTRFIITLSFITVPTAVLCMVAPRSSIRAEPISPIKGVTPPSTTVEHETKYFGQQVSKTPKIDKRRRGFLAGGAFTCTCGLCGASIPPSERFSDEIWLLDRFETRAEKENTLGARFARVMAGSMRDYEESEEVRGFKKELFAGVSKGDRVLEIGVGSGPNLEYYGKKAGVVLAVEPNRSFDVYARLAAAATGTNLEIVPGRAEEIPVDDASVDVVVGTMVLCSVKSVRRSLREVHRVLRPGGRFLFTEHTRAPEDWHLLDLAQRIASPAQVALAEGCHLRRQVRPDIEAVFGLPNVKARNFVLSNTDRSPPWPPHFLLSPHLVGYATKA